MARPRVTQPTDAHVRVLKALIRLKEQKRPTAILELAELLGLKGPSSLSATLGVIERLGLITKIGGGKRGKRQLFDLTSAGMTAAGQLGIPLLGSIPAGQLQEVLENAEERVELPELMPYEEGDFLLSVRGESMIGDGILDGDLVLLRPKVDANQGEIAAVRVDDEHTATLKHVYVDRERQIVTLKASNPKYADIEVDSNKVWVAGVYRGLVRNPSFVKVFRNYGI